MTAPLRHGAVELRPPRRRDGPAWVEVRLANQEWLEPWEATPPATAGVPWRERQTVVAWSGSVRVLRRATRRREAAAYVVRTGGRLVGQVTVAPVQRGAVLSGNVGYWVDHRAAGRGIGTAAVALAADVAFGRLDLHRIEAAVRPENAASRRLLARLGFREEGLARGLLLVDGSWRDHVLCALTREELPHGGVVSRLRHDTP